MVVSRGFLKEKDFEFVKSEIRDIKKICKKKAHLKVILETCEIPSLDLVYQASY
jgi:deoxyribose-phosphate aldolase